MYTVLKGAEMRQHVENMHDYCTIEAAMAVVGGKWKMVILNHLFDGTRRFGELGRAMPDITQRMLTRQLRELEADGLVRRTVYPEMPPKVEYSVTELGANLRPIAEQLQAWGRHYRNEMDS